MADVADAAPLLLGDDLIVEILRHALELGDHRLDLRDLPPLLVDLEALQPDDSLHATSCDYSLATLGRFTGRPGAKSRQLRRFSAAALTFHLRLALIMTARSLNSG